MQVDIEYKEEKGQPCQTDENVSTIEALVELEEKIQSMEYVNDQDRAHLQDLTETCNLLKTEDLNQFGPPLVDEQGENADISQIEEPNALYDQNQVNAGSDIRENITIFSYEEVIEKQYNTKKILHRNKERQENNMLPGQPDMGEHTSYTLKTRHFTKKRLNWKVPSQKYPCYIPKINKKRCRKSSDNSTRFNEPAKEVAKGDVDSSGLNETAVDSENLGCEASVDTIAASDSMHSPILMKKVRNKI